EVDVNRMAPPLPTVFDVPDLKRSFPAETGLRRSGGELGRCGNPSRVHRKSGTAIGIDGPRRLVGAGRAAEGEGTMPCLGQLGLIDRIVAMERQHDHGFLSR